MKIGLLNLEPQINNTALMKISGYHKKQGDTVEMYIDFFRNQYDKIYCSSLFDFTPKHQVPENAICGGTGFDIKKKLPKDIENSDLDYSIYPDCDKSYIWFSRGCIRNCPFCIVRQKEGYIKQVKPSNLNSNGKVIHIMDNNFFANPNWEDAEKYLDKWNQKVVFDSGVDVRIFEPDHAKFIKKYIKRPAGYSIHTAWDNPKENLIPKFKELINHIPPYMLMAYVLIGYWSTEEEDLMRVNELLKLKIDPFIMPYNKFDHYQSKLARYVNKKEILKSCSWEEYKYN